MKRRTSALEEVISAFGAMRSGPCPFTDEVPAGIEVFDVPQKVRKILCIMRAREEVAARLIGSGGGCNDGGMWNRRNMLAEGIEYLVNDYVRAIYRKSDRYSVDYWEGWKCSFKIT